MKPLFSNDPLDKQGERESRYTRTVRADIRIQVSMPANTKSAEWCEDSRICGLAFCIEMVYVVPRGIDMGFCTGASIQSCNLIIGSGVWYFCCSTVYR
jgi:hypothetical protein